MCVCQYDDKHKCSCPCECECVGICIGKCGCKDLKGRCEADGEGYSTCRYKGNGKRECEGMRVQM